MSEQNVGVRELKSHLSQYLQRVKAGETLVITERGKPVGRLTPVEKSLEERLLGFVEAGLADWDGKKLIPRQPLAINRSEQLVSDLVEEARDIDYIP